MSYPEPVMCTLCGNATIGTHPGGLCRVCAAPERESVHLTSDPMPVEWRVNQVHVPCVACAVAADKAIAHARCVGSHEGYYSDNGNHAARVVRVIR